MNALFLGLAETIEGGALQAGALWALSDIPGFPPLIQTVHILGIAAIMGSVVMINLRMLGLALPSQSLPEMNRRLMPWLWWALLANVVSGGFFLFARPFRYFDNPVFLWKLAFLLPAIIVSYLVYVVSIRSEDSWSRTAARRVNCKIAALLSLGLWIMTAMAGRWIPYAEYLYYPA